MFPGASGHHKGASKICEFFLVVIGHDGWHPGKEDHPKISFSWGNPLGPTIISLEKT